MATVNLPQGVAKAWVVFDGTGTVTIRDSHNVDSITDNGTGDYTLNLTSGALASTNFAAAGLVNDGFSASTIIDEQGSSRSANAIRVQCRTNSGDSVVDRQFVCVVLFGDA